MHLVPYSPDDSRDFYNAYYLEEQTGNGIQVYKGRDVMGGSGIGAALLRVAAPLLKNVGKSLLKRGLVGASKVATDVVLGKNFSQSAKQRFKDEAGDLVGDVAQAVLPDRLKRAKARKRKTTAKKRSTGNKRRKTIF